MAAVLLVDQLQHPMDYVTVSQEWELYRTEHKSFAFMAEDNIYPILIIKQNVS